MTFHSGYASALDYYEGRPLPDSVQRRVDDMRRTGAPPNYIAEYVEGQMRIARERERMLNTQPPDIPQQPKPPVTTHRKELLCLL